jgi:hypothetical protein
VVTHDYDEATRPRLATAAVLAITLILVGGAAAQEAQVPELRAGAYAEGLIIDGSLSEAAWTTAEGIDVFTQAEPDEGAPATTRTVAKVLASPAGLVIGILCDDPEPRGIVSFSVRRDAPLAAEDHVRVVLGPFMDGRSGYVFAVNPSGARYDGLIEPGGEGDNADWDGIWEAAVVRTDSGWSVEIAIPIQTLSFAPGRRAWHFNVQRRLQRRLETSRWAFPARQYQVTQTSRAGIITNLPDFDLGLGLSVRPAITSGGGHPAPERRLDGDVHPSLDLTKRLGSNLLASLTVNTDFAETEVDTRRTNLTRFPLFFPEKRTFFLEGSDIFSFGLGLNEDVVPFFSRRLGLVGGSQVPITLGGKINGRIADTNVGGLIARSSDEPDVVSVDTVMAAGRIKQNVLSESWLGAIATVGDPIGREGSWLGGADFTYATSHFRGDKNFLVGAWALATGRDGLGRDATAHGFKIDYPNDLWDMQITYKRIGRDFDPSMGFVPRRAVHLLNGQANNRTRLATGPLQQLFHQFQPSAAWDLAGHWESYRFFIAPINWRFRSGDRAEFNVNPTGERLVEPFQIGGVTIPAGPYHWRRYRLEAGTAQKRRLYTQLTWWFGGFYDGTLDQVQWTGAWNPTALLTVEFSGERNIGTLAAGRFTQTLVGTRLRVNVSPNLSIASYTQYDTDSDSVGVNTRLRWTFRPVGDLFVVYNHNVRSLVERWQLDSNQLLVKLQYAWRL